MGISRKGVGINPVFVSQPRAVKLSDRDVRDPSLRYLKSEVMKRAEQTDARLLKD